MRLHFVATAVPEAQSALANLRQLYDDSGPEKAEVIVALGGDGFMLQTLHAFIDKHKPIYGMNLGTVGFLMNEYNETALPGRLSQAERAVIHPLRMHAATADETIIGLAFNEVSLLRQTRQATKLRILVDGKVRISELICDGALIATVYVPGGSVNWYRPFPSVVVVCVRLPPAPVVPVSVSVTPEMPGSPAS